MTGSGRTAAGRRQGREAGDRHTMTLGQVVVRWQGEEGHRTSCWGRPPAQGMRALLCCQLRGSADGPVAALTGTGQHRVTSRRLAARGARRDSCTKGTPRAEHGHLLRISQLHGHCCLLGLLGREVPPGVDYFTFTGGCQHNPVLTPEHVEEARQPSWDAPHSLVVHFLGKQDQSRLWEALLPDWAAMSPPTRQGHCHGHLGGEA